MNGTDLSPEEYERQGQFNVKSETVLKSFYVYKPNISLLRELMETPRNFRIVGFFGCNLYKDMAYYFQAGVTQKEESHRREFISFVKMMFLRLEERHKLKFHDLFIKLWSKLALDYSKFFESISDNFNSDLERCFEVLVENKNQKDVDDDVLQELRWMILISPAATFVKLLVQAANHFHIITSILELCRLTPSLFNDSKHRFWQSDFELKSVPEKLTTLLFRRLIFEGRAHFTTAEQWNNVDSIGVKLTVSQDGLPPIMKPEDLLEVALSELCSPTRIPVKSIEVLITTCERLLDRYNPHQLEFEFATSRRQQPREGLFLTPTIIDMALKLTDEFHGVSSIIVENASHFLREIGFRMSRENVEFDEETIKHIKEIDLPGFSWFIETAFFFWFSTPLRVEAFPIPTEIYQALNDNSKVHFVELHSDYVFDDLGEAYFRLLFQLAVVDSKTALKIFSYGCNINFKNVDLVMLFEKALWDGEFKNVPLDPDERIQFEKLLTDLLCRIEHMGVSRPDQKTIYNLMALPACREPRIIVPAHAVYPTQPIQALDEPIAPEWPSGSFTMPKSDLRAIQKKHREDYQRLCREVRESHDQRVKAMSEKWKGEGVVDEHHKPRGRLNSKELGFTARAGRFVRLSHAMTADEKSILNEELKFDRLSLGERHDGHV